MFIARLRQVQDEDNVQFPAGPEDPIALRRHRLCLLACEVMSNEIRVGPLGGPVGEWR